jgi:hypothetical protein
VWPPAGASVGACELHATVDVTTVAASTATLMPRATLIACRWTESSAWHARAPTTGHRPLSSCESVPIAEPVMGRRGGESDAYDVRACGCVPGEYGISQFRGRDHAGYSQELGSERE